MTRHLNLRRTRDDDVLIPNFLSAKQAAEDLGVTADRVKKLCRAGRIPGAIKLDGTFWIVPKPFRVLFAPKRLRHPDKMKFGLHATNG